MSPIHPTAIVDPAAQIDPSVEIGPHVIIEGPVKIGPRTRVMANSYLCGDTQIGADNLLHIGVVIGAEPQHLSYKGEPSGVRIGDRNVFREYVTIHRAYHAGHFTTVGDGNFIMANCHIGHDCTLGNDNVMANGSLLGGHVIIENRVVMSGNVGVHQFARIGQLSMIGGLARISKDIPPFMLVGDDSAICGLNTIGLRRGGFDAETREKIKQAYKILYRSNLNVPVAVARIEEELADCKPVMELVEFIRKSPRGISRHTRHEQE
ncbi:MAG: acyl-ACP--UDP-N-acetylglucosamine O-acyltransferase [Candidatus Sumerlaeaceae bacterium]|nr:acyl-ACP--UDP-N-acetylglucosamine O-acyltransferase [Candidatus Sumerlaeaceae bacterium]